MTQSQQIALLSNIDNDVQTLKVLYDNFKDYASASPIGGARETTIMEDFETRVKVLRELYNEVIVASADWITQQP